MNLRETYQIKRAPKFLVSVLLVCLGFVTGSLILQSCQPDEITPGNNGELCDTCVIVLAPEIPEIKKSSDQH